MEISQGTFAMLPPHPGACQVCAQEHEEELPHNRDSLFYQMWFNATYKRSPTWMDAALHCTEEMRSHWIGMLKEKGVPKAVIGLQAEGDRNG